MSEALVEHEAAASRWTSPAEIYEGSPHSRTIVRRAALVFANMPVEERLPYERILRLNEDLWRDRQDRFHLAVDVHHLADGVGLDPHILWRTLEAMIRRGGGGRNRA